jgi:hypothetical protein
MKVQYRKNSPDNETIDSFKKEVMVDGKEQSTHTVSAISDETKKKIAWLSQNLHVIKKMNVDAPFYFDPQSDPEYENVTIMGNMSVRLHPTSAKVLKEYIRQLELDDERDMEEDKYLDLVLVKIYQLMAERLQLISVLADDVEREMDEEYDQVENAHNEGVKATNEYYLQKLVDHHELINLLTRKEVTQVARMITKIYKKNQRISKIMQKFHNSPTEIFKYIYKFEPVGNITIHRGNYMLCFECNEFTDLYRALNENREFAEDTGGSTSDTRGFEIGLRDVICLVNNTRNRSFKDIRQTIMHEQRHCIDRLFFRSFGYPLTKIPENYNKGLYDNESLQIRILASLEAMKSEILARLKEGLSYEQTMNWLCNYNFLKDDGVEDVEIQKKFYKKVAALAQIAYEINDINLLAVTPVKDWKRIARVVPKKGKIKWPYVFIVTDSGVTAEEDDSITL